MLDTIKCNNNFIDYIILTEAKNLSFLDCSENKLMQLNIKLNKNIKNLNIGYNLLDSINLKNQPLLDTLKCVNSGLKYLDLTSCTNINYLNCSLNSGLNLVCAHPKYTINTVIKDSHTTISSKCLAISDLPLSIVMFATDSVISFSLYGYSKEAIHIDWGDGILEKTYLSTTSGYFTGKVSDTVKIYCNKIKEIYVSNHAITHLDLTRCNYLTYIYISGISIEELNIMNNDYLQQLVFFKNNVPVKVSLNNLLTLNDFVCDNNKITDIVINNCPNLRNIVAYRNLLVSIKLNNCQSLKSLILGSNKLETIDLSNLSNLKSVQIDNNLLKGRLDISNIHTNLYVPGNPDLKEICIMNNQDTTNIVKDSTAKLVYGCTTYTRDEVPAPIMRFAADTNFVSMVCTSINFNEPIFIDWGDGILYKYNNSYLNNDIKFWGNPTDTVTIYGTGSFKTIDCSNNKITYLDVNRNFFLENLYCNNNALQSLEINNLNRLLNVNCSNNNISKLSITYCNALKTLDCSYNNLINLNVEALRSLNVLKCNNNKLENLYCNNMISEIHCSNNNLTEFLTHNYNNLRYFFISDNNLNNLLLQKNYYLEKFDTRNNPNLLQICIRDNYYTQISVDSHTKVNRDCMTTPTLPLAIQFKTNQRTIEFQVQTYGLKTKVQVEWGSNLISEHEGIGLITIKGTTNGEVWIFADNLITFRCDSLQITELNTKYSTRLKQLYCSGNLIENLYLSPNYYLETVYCNGNNLKTLDLRNNIFVKVLKSHNNPNLRMICIDPIHTFSSLEKDAHTYISTTCILKELPTGLASDSVTKFTVYPNPSSGSITIEYYLNTTENVSINVVRENGSALYQTNGIKPQGFNKEFISNVPSG
ncbi:MAG: hypothetical protein SNJ71_08120, partial [Bacteroidales bacterium]